MASTLVDKLSFLLPNTDAGDDGAEKSEVIYKRENTIFTPSVYPSAKVMAECVYKAYLDKQFEDTAYFEPYYLKDFVDGKK